MCCKYCPDMKIIPRKETSLVLIVLKYAISAAVIAMIVTLAPLLFDRLGTL